MIKVGENVKRLREAASVTQEELAKEIGISRPTLTNIEANKRKVSAEELAKLADYFNISADEILGRTQEPEIEIIEERAKTPKEEIRISVPQRNIEKFKEVLLYILNKVGSKPNVGQTVIYKLLYFMDFNYYEKYEEQLIGATYKKNQYGPTPLEFKEVIRSLGDDLEKVDSNFFTYPQTKYLPKRTANLACLNANELEEINYVLEKLSDMNATQISKYSHDDIPWKAAPNGGIIDYEGVFYRTPEYSVRDYGDEI
jgi:transcriptional regulator with XRE-family HTH domain